MRAQGTGDAKTPQPSPSPSRFDTERSGQPDCGERRKGPGLESCRCQETGREVQARGWDGETLKSFVE